MTEKCSLLSKPDENDLKINLLHHFDVMNLVYISLPQLISRSRFFFSEIFIHSEGKLKPQEGHTFLNLILIEWCS